MPSHYNLATGAFAGNCAPNTPPPEGYGYTDIDFAAGTINPMWNGTAWEAGLPLPAADPAPNYSAAWADLITSPLYQRALGLAFTALPVNTAMTTFGIAFQAHRDLPHEVWAGALSAAAGHLAMAINATETPLTTDEQDWVELWNTAHNLGLTINWEAVNG